MDTNENKVKTVIGTVVSDKMDKTIVVQVTTKSADKLYKKYVKKSTRFHVHDEKNIAKIGDVVKIAHSRPISRTKFWTLVDFVSQKNELAQ